MIYRYLDCGNLHNGFARVKCKDCCHEYLLAYSCKRRHFCPSCHQKRVVEFGEWLAAMCSHIPNRGGQMVRYYGYYSNVSQGKRQKEDLDDAIPCILEPQENEKAFRKNLARLIQKIYEVDPLICPKCQGTMRIISFMVRQAHHARLPLILSLSKDGW